MAVAGPTFMDTRWYFWCSGNECIRIMDMHYARDVVAGQVDALVVGDVIF